MRLIGVVFFGIAVTGFSGCYTFTGIPSHGGGKRFAIEQELISASARAVAKDIDVTELLGKKCALYVISIGDEGSGNLLGGRFNWRAAIQGDYTNAPATRSSYPVVDTVTTTTTGGVVTTTDAENALNAPNRTNNDGARTGASVGATFQGAPDYRAEPFINPRDVQFLNAALHEAFVLRGVIIVAPERADIDVYVTVDVFGTHRSRSDFIVYNKESLRAKTALQVTAFDRERKPMLSPRTSSFEAEYVENYVLWMGPTSTSKLLRRSDSLLVDFSTMPAAGAWCPAGTELGPPLLPGAVDQETRTKPVTTPTTSPDTWRPEDVKKDDTKTE
jgi:hypothetical protein